MNTEKLMQLKQNFTGQRFQWIKTQDPTLLGSVLKCKDVVFTSGDYYAIFDNNSKININSLNKNLMMIHGDQKPLSINEVKSISPPPINTINTKKQTTTSHVEKTVATTPFQKEKTSNVNVKSFSIFESWKHEQSSISLKLDIALPSKKLLKMMYSNAENKEDFISQLSEYLEQKINKQILADSVKKILAVQPRAKTKSTEITIKEVK